MRMKGLGLVAGVVLSFNVGCGGDVPFGSGAGGAGAMGGQSGQGGGGGAGMGGAGGMSSAPDWGCLGSVSAPVFGAETVTAIFSVTTLGGGVDKAEVQICGLDDAACDNPVAEGTTDGSGQLSAMVPNDGPHYAQVETPGAASTLQFINGPVEGGATIPIEALTKTQLDAFVTQLEGMALAGAGHVVALALDCNGVPASGVQFELDNATDTTLLGYMDEDGNLDPSLSATSAHGGAFFANLPPGLATVTATLENDTLSLRTILVRSGWLSQAAPSTPTPRPQQ